MDVKSSLAPVIDVHTRIVILGSLPGEASLAAQQYYAHPRNQFWRLMSEILQLDLLALPYAQRLPALLERHIGLWDVVGHAQRHGSLDSALKNIHFNDLNTLLARCPALCAVGCNGNTAARQAPWLENRGLQVLRLPSSSPAHTLPYAEKLQHWRQLQALLIA